MESKNTIGKHLATLNLFREADNSLHITIAECKGAMLDRTEMGEIFISPLAYTKALIKLAVKNLR